MTMSSGPGFGNNATETFSDSTAAEQSTAAELGVNSAQPQARPTGESGTGMETGMEQARRQMHDATHELKGAASKATDATRRTATQAKDAAGRMVEQATGQVKQLTQQLTQQVSDQGVNLFNEQKSRAADSLGGISAALRRAGETLQDEQDKNLASYAQSLAGGVESSASYLRDSDVRGLMRDAGDFARRRPEWALGGAFLAGLALIRFLKASRSDSDGAEYDNRGSTSHLDYATSDEFTGDRDDASRRYRSGAYPGVGGQMSGANPDMEEVTPAIAFDATSTNATTNLNPDITCDDANARPNPATGLTL